MVSLVRGAMLIVTLICWSMSLYKMRDLARDRGNRPLRALCLALVAITLSLTLQPLMPAIDRFFGVLDVVRLTSNCLSLVCATAAQAFLLYLTSSDASTRRRVRRRLLALTATSATMVILFVSAPPATDVSDPRVLSGEYYGDPFAAPFLYPYLAYLGWSLVQVVILANRYARIAPRPLLRFGLRLIVVGSLWGLAYVAAKLVAVAVSALSPDSALITDAVVVLTFTTSILLVLIGSTIPSWGPRVGLDRLWSWAAALHDYYRLYPLWAQIHAVLPEIALLPPGSGVHGVISIARNASLRRVRITVEILDGYANLRPWISASVFIQAEQRAAEAGLTGDRHAAVVEAAVVGAALSARRAGRPAADHPNDVPQLGIGPQGTTRPDGTNVGAAGQVTWLIQVARAISSSLVAEIISRATSAADHSAPQPSER